MKTLDEYIKMYKEYDKNFYSKERDKLETWMYSQIVKYNNGDMSIEEYNKMINVYDFVLSVELFS